jgi:hypothetical protein
MIITSITYLERILTHNIFDKKCIYPFLEGHWTLFSWAQDVDKDPSLTVGG